MATDLSPLTPAEKNTSVGGGTDLSPLTPEERNSALTPQGPTLAEKFGFRPATRQEAIVARGATQAVLAPVDMAAKVIQSGRNIPWSPLDLTASETGQQPTEAEEAASTPHTETPELPAPSSALLDAVGLKAPPNMTSAEQTEASVIPWLVPSPGAASRVAEAPGLISKGAALLGSTAMGGADWAASNAAQEWANKQNYSPFVQKMVGVVAPLLRGALFRGAGTIAHAAGGGEEGGVMHDLYREEGQTPPLSEVTSPAVQEFQKWAGSFPLFNSTAIGHMIGGPHGAALAGGLAAGGKLFSGAVNDPSIVRAFADRGLTEPLIEQYISRGSLGATAPQEWPPPSPSGIANTILNYLPTGGGGSK